MHHPPSRSGCKSFYWKQNAKKKKHYHQHHAVCICLFRKPPQSSSFLLTPASYATDWKGNSYSLWCFTNIKGHISTSIHTWKQKLSERTCLLDSEWCKKTSVEFYFHCKIFVFKFKCLTHRFSASLWMGRPGREQSGCGKAKDKMFKMCIFCIGQWSQWLKLHKSFSQNPWHPLQMVEILSYWA